MECVDLYKVGRKAKEILEGESRYFSQGGLARQESGGLSQMWEDLREERRGEDDGIRRVRNGEDVPQEQELADIPDRNLRLEYTEGKYVLVWDWVGEERSAVVQIWQDGGMKRRYPCSVDQFNERVGRCPYGVDVSDGLPAGKINVRVSSGDSFDVVKQMAGRQCAVQYKLEPQKQNGYTLSIEGAPANVEKLVLRVQNDKGRALLYPLALSPQRISNHAFRFENLMLNASKSELITPPEDLYPTVRVIRAGHNVR